MSKYNSCIEGCELPSTPNELKILVKQLRREVLAFYKDTTESLLDHDRKNSRAMQIHKR